MKSLIVITLLSSLLGGCIKLNIAPENAVKSSFEAGKSLVDEARLKHKGGQKKDVSRQVLISAYQDRAEAEKHCFTDLKDKLTRESTHKPPVIISEQVVIVDGLKNNTIECRIVAFIWPGN